MDLAKLEVVEVLYATAFALFNQDRLREAATVFRTMLKAAPTDERAWTGLAECHERVEQYRIALELFGAGTLAARPSARCTLGRARVLRKLGDDDQARAELESARDLAVTAGDRAVLEAVDQEAAAWP
jgi:Flp pilus assembly protein TadD